MRDPKRIKRLLKLIEHIWMTNQDMRLMQLLGNVYDSGREYFIEDDELENALHHTYALRRINVEAPHE